MYAHTTTLNLPLPRTTYWWYHFKLMWQLQILGLLEGYQKLCDAAQKVSPALTDLEERHLSRFTLTWEVFNKHLYQLVIYTDPLIQNNLPIFISQVRK